MAIKDRIQELQNIIPAEVTLVAVSKTHPIEALQEAWDAGQRVFGESRPQEMVAKQLQLPSEAKWHMIGHLQRNKVRMIIPFVDMIHSVDSPRLLETIQQEAEKVERKVNVLLEIHVAKEESKHGWQEDELIDFLEGGNWRDMPNIEFRGIMGIASNTDDQQLVKSEFIHLRRLFEVLQRDYFDCRFDTLSMGMTSDFQMAIGCGSNMVRIGSMIFGDR